MSNVRFPPIADISFSPFSTHCGRKRDLTAISLLHWILALSLASFAVLLVGWATVVRPARNWGLQLELARREAEQALEPLATSQFELQAANQRLFRQARTDPLTGLQTRLKFAEDIKLIWSRVRRYGESYSIVMCDIDHFKQYNDIYGHGEGDEVLRSVAGAFKATAREGDQLYRYGGEEFVLIIQTGSLKAGQECAERFRAAVEKRQIQHAGGSTGFVSVSLGVSQLDSAHELTVECLLERTDAAMYEAKKSGRNRVAIHVAA